MHFPTQSVYIEAAADIQIHAKVAGNETKPLLVLCHGFPSCWYSWHKQIAYFAKQGYLVVAIDQRGYGKSSRPSSIKNYCLDEQCSDLLAIVKHFGKNNAIFIGHDFGASQVWAMGTKHPEVCRAIVGVATPHGMTLSDGNLKPSEIFELISQQHFFHMHYFQQPGVADQELSNNSENFLQRLYWTLSAKGNLLDWVNYSSEGTGYLDVLNKAPELPWPWMSKEQFVSLHEAFTNHEDSPYTGGLNYYRALDLNWEQEKNFPERTIANIPCLYIAGAQDPVLTLAGDNAINNMKALIDQLDSSIIDGAGHFIQLEQADLFNTRITNFLGQLG